MPPARTRSEEHTSELQSRPHLVCRLLLEKKKEHLSKKYSCIIFDRHECGQSGGRIEHVTCAHYVAQGKGLLDHLNIKRAFFFFFNDTATTEIYTLSLHDALPI